MQISPLEKERVPVVWWLKGKMATSKGAISNSSRAIAFTFRL